MKVNRGRLRSFTDDAQNSLNAPLIVFGSGCPRRSTDPQRLAPMPVGSAEPACTLLLYPGKNAPRFVVITDRDKHLIKERIVQNFESRRS
jgi:hypothetical protein